MNHYRHAPKKPGIGHSLCSTIAVVITAMLAWSFVESTSTARWMGADALVAWTTPADWPAGREQPAA